MHVLNTHFMHGNDCVTRSIAGETIIVPVRSHVVDLDAIYTLNEVGTLIWNHLDGQTDGQQIAEAVCHAYDVTPEAAAQDTRAFLDTLVAADLIRPVEPAPGANQSER